MGPSLSLDGLSSGRAQPMYSTRNRVNGSEARLQAQIILQIPPLVVIPGSRTGDKIDQYLIYLSFMDQVI